MSLRVSQKVASKVNQCKKIVSPVLNQQQRFASVNPVVQHHEKLRPSVQVDPLEPIRFPRQRPGLEYDLNWSLVPLQITPYHDSFRNASVENLLKLSYGETTKDNTLVFDASASTANVEKLITFHPEELKTNWKVFAPKFHRRVQREVAYYLTHVPSSFVQDGDFGFGVKLRVITDNANTGLVLKNLILSTRKLSAVDFKSDAMIFHAPGYQFTPANVVAEFNGPTPTDLGLNNDQFVMLNDQENKITIGGVQDLNVLIDSIVHVASKAALAKQSLIIPSDAILSKTGVTLIVNNEDGGDVAQLRKNALAGTVSKNYQLYSSHHNMLSKEGLSRVWNGSRVIVDSATFKKLKLNAGTVVESINGGNQYIVTSKDSARPTVVKSPSAIVFMARDSSNSVPTLGKISAETAKNLLLSGKATSGFPELSADNVKQVFDQLTSNVQFYVINSAQDQKTIAQAVDSVATGSVKSAVEADSAVQSFLMGGKK